MNILQFFDSFSDIKPNVKWVLFEDFIEAQDLDILRQVARKQKRDFSSFEIKAEGPSADLEAAFATLDFFSAAKIFHLHLKSLPSKWEAAAFARWEKILELSSVEGNWLFVSADNAETLKKSAPLLIQNGPEAVSVEAWVRFLNKFLNSTLDAKRVEFLQQQSADTLLDYKHWIELWNLGGDEWAEHALGWGRKVAPTYSASHSSQNPAYAWVDAALNGRKDVFLKLSEELVQNKGEDPLRLWALLGKSVKISAQIAMGEEPVGEAPFLVTKLKRQKVKPELLDWWCKCDLAMKSTRADVMGLWAQMP